MNKHRNYYSVMGIEPNKEKSVKQLRREENRKALEKMIAIDGFNEIATLFREIYETTPKEEVNLFD